MSVNPDECFVPCLIRVSFQPRRQGSENSGSIAPTLQACMYVIRLCHVYLARKIRELTWQVSEVWWSHHTQIHRSDSNSFASNSTNARWMDRWIWVWFAPPPHLWALANLFRRASTAGHNFEVFFFLSFESVRPHFAQNIFCKSVCVFLYGNYILIIPTTSIFGFLSDFVRIW